MKVLLEMALDNYSKKNFELDDKTTIPKWLEKTYGVKKVKASTARVVDFLVRSNASYSEERNCITININGKRSKLMGYIIVGNDHPNSCVSTL